MSMFWRSRVSSTVKQLCLFGNQPFPLGKPNFTIFAQAVARNLSSFRERKRFYKKAGIEKAEGGYQITVDSKKVKTPAGNPLVVPSKHLAMAVSVEWNSQVETIKPAYMHLTSLSNTVIDNPRPRTHDEQVLNILEFLSSDSICFYADEPEELVNLQKKEWEPIMQWFNKRYAVSVEPSHGLITVTVAIPSDAKERLKTHLTPLDTWSLTGLEFAVETLKSFILSMALLDSHLTVETAVRLSRLELEFQISRWGSVEWAHDLELMETRSRVAAAALFYSLNNRDRTLSTSS
ncbi:hypothetical protein ACROYT_G038500 [Oculina patagonica]